MKVGEKTIFVFKQGDITKEAVDAIVNAANSSLCGGGGVDGAIHRAGGPSIMAELKQIVQKFGKCPVGDAVITGAGKLKAQHIVHAVGPVWSGGKKNEAESLESAYYNSLVLAKEYGAKTVALPAISTGAYGYPMEEAAKVAVKAVVDFCKDHPCFDEVRFVLFDQSALQSYERVAAGIS